MFNSNEAFRATTAQPPHVFVIDDDPEIQNLLRKLFTIENYSVEIFSNALEATERLKFLAKTNKPKCDLIVCDLKLPGLDGLGFIEQVNRNLWNIPIILITANASVETAVLALKSGAFDYVVKPIHLAELSIVAKRAIEHRQLEADHRSLQKKFQDHLTNTASLGTIIGKSPKMRQVFDLVSRVAKTTSNVLVTGESGTGKELIARAIHQKSERSQAPFIAINCSAIPDQLLESELFGHRKGSFTGASENRPGLFEEAQGGTVFLDEIGDMPLTLQVKLLRVLQERKIKAVGDNHFKEIDIRIISATHKNIRQLIQDGKFREDLYYRICVIPIHIPPLRERKDDIPLMADFFLKKYCDLNSLLLKRLTASAITQLLKYRWPGNVRELENTLERSVVLCEGNVIEDRDICLDETEEPELTVDHLDTQVDTRVDSKGDTQGDIKASSPFIQTSPGGFSEMLTLQELESQYIRHVLTSTEHSKEKAAKILGINRKTLYRKLHEFSP